MIRIEKATEANKEFAEAKKQKITELMHAGNQGRLDLLLKDFNFTYTSRNSDKTPPGIITVLDLDFGCKFKIRTPMDISEEVIFY